MQTKYQLDYKLAGHAGAIVCLAMRDDGKYLASGGSDGTKVWDVGRASQINTALSPDIRGATTALLWLKRADDVGEALFFGTEKGYLVGWREVVVGETASFHQLWVRHLTQATEVTSLAFDPVTNRFAVCMRGGVLQLYRVTATMNLTTVFSFSIPNCVPRAVGFGTMYGNERQLIMFGLYCGLAYFVRGVAPPTIEQAWNLGSRIGGIALDATNNVLCIDDPSTGVHTYRLGEQELVKSLETPRQKKHMRIRGVCLGEGVNIVVSGSDHGVVYVRNRRSGKLEAQLRVDSTEWVQTVATGSLGGVPYIFAGKSRDLAESNEIFVYRKMARAKNGSVLVRLGGQMRMLFNVLVFVAAAAFVYQNIVVLLM